MAVSPHDGVAGTTGGVATVSVRVIAWAALAALFVGLRLSPIWRTDVGGAELVHLSGAWLASLGAADGRFIPTLFQALSAGVFAFTESETPVRLLAFLATASVPFAIYRLRPRLTEPGALLTLLLLSLDGPLINLGVSASAMGFDLAIACWLLVLVASGSRSRVLWASAGFLCVTGGALVFPLALTGVGVAAYRWHRTDAVVALSAAVGALGGIASASGLAWALGANGGDRVVVPIVDVFGASFAERWSTGTAWEVGLVYGLPLVLAGVPALALGVKKAWRDRGVERFHLWLLAWAVAAAGWWVAAAGEHTSAPYASLAVAFAFLVGPAAASVLGSLDRVDWRFAGWLAAGVAGFAALAGMRLARWAALDAVGPAGEQAAMAAFVVGGLICVGALAWERNSRPALGLVVGVLGLGLYATTGIGVGVSGVREPAPSPLTTQQARELRTYAVAEASGRGGDIVIHPDLLDSLTWPLRGAGRVVVANEPAGGTVLIWPEERPAPLGYSRVGETWALERFNEPPGDGLFGYVRWLANRNDTVTGSVTAAVYARDSDE